MARVSRLAGTLLLVGATGVTPARAEIVYLTSGRTLSVRASAVDQDTVRLTLRSGGQIVCSRALVARIVPDEVPYPEPETTPVKAPAVAGNARFRETIAAAAATYGVDPDLVRAVIEVESSYEPRAVSAKGAMGLMQLMPATARQYGLTDPFDPSANIDAGTRHLKTLLDRYDVSLALAAYNAGEATVARFGGVPPYRETRDYVGRVMARLPRR
jgi:soluble lytic murein transglycosylase-like protein